MKKERGVGLQPNLNEVGQLLPDRYEKQGPGDGKKMRAGISDERYSLSGSPG